jgi:hypothetical protein
MFDGVVVTGPRELAFVTASIPDGLEERVPVRDVDPLVDMCPFRTPVVELVIVGAIPRRIEHILIWVQVIRRPLYCRKHCQQTGIE